jgi:hypothetical protein
MFRIQDSKFNQILNYVLIYVKENYQRLNQKKQ